MKAITKKRIKEIIKWYDKTDYKIAVIHGQGVNLGANDLIELLIILANSENIKKDFREFMMNFGFSGKG